MRVKIVLFLFWNGQFSTESNLENLDEDEIDASSHVDGETAAETKEANDSEGEGSTHVIRKVKTIPAALRKKSK